jgi:hypothetical protein
VRCAACPVPAGLECRGEAIPHTCDDPRYRAYFARAAAEGRTFSPPPPTLPGRRRMAGQAIRSAWSVLLGLLGGDPLLTPVWVRRRRWAACRSCDRFRPEDRRCGAGDGCGCHLAAKIPLAALACPLDPPRWTPWRGARVKPRRGQDAPASRG